jgi:hypothetical protein
MVSKAGARQGQDAAHRAAALLSLDQDWTCLPLEEGTAQTQSQIVLTLPPGHPLPAQADQLCHKDTNQPLSPWPLLEMALESV